MKLILCSILFASVILFDCNSKQKTQKPVEDSVRVDSVHPPPLVELEELPEEKREYDSSVQNHFMFKNLSRQFNVELNISRFIEGDHLHDSCIARAILFDKKSKHILDSVFVTSLFFYRNYFNNAHHAVSYSTRVHVFKQIVDNYAGDLIVDDLNFDGRDDVVMINDMGGNNGPFYSYFIQQADQKFILDKYLTDSVTYFPAEINRKRKTLTTYENAGACCVGKQVYQFDSAKQQWKQIKHVILGEYKQNSKP
jgi:hypothetical protein